MRYLDKIADWLTPNRRLAIHKLAGAIGLFLTLLGIVDEQLVVGALGILAAVLSGASLVLAAIKTRRAVWQAAYAALAIVLASLVTAGIVFDGDASHWLDLAAAAVAITPWLAAIRTDTTTPTGEPANEYAAKHGGVYLVTDAQPAATAADVKRILGDPLRED